MYGSHRRNSGHDHLRHIRYGCDYLLLHIELRSNNGYDLNREQNYSAIIFKWIHDSTNRGFGENKMTLRNLKRRSLKLSIIFIGALCANSCAVLNTSVSTHVSSISNQHVKKGSVYIYLENSSIENKKIRNILYRQLSQRGFEKSAPKDAAIIVVLSSGILGSENKIRSSSQPVYSQYTDGATGMPMQQVSGYHTSVSSTTYHQKEIRLEFLDAQLVKEKSKEQILWEAVGRSSGSSSEIIKTAELMLSSMLDKLNESVDAEESNKMLNDEGKIVTDSGVSTFLKRYYNLMD